MNSSETWGCQISGQTFVQIDVVPAKGRLWMEPWPFSLFFWNLPHIVGWSMFGKLRRSSWERLCFLRLVYSDIRREPAWMMLRRGVPFSSTTKDVAKFFSGPTHACGITAGGMHCDGKPLMNLHARRGWGVACETASSMSTAHVASKIGTGVQLYSPSEAFICRLTNDRAWRNLRVGAALAPRLPGFGVNESHAPGS